MFDSITNFVSSITLKGALLGLLIFVVTLGLSLAIVSFVLVKLPPTYFKPSHDRQFFADKPPVIRVLALIGKNLLGIVLVVVGVLLSLPGVPGRGVLTILLGIMLLDFPGRQKLEHWLVSRRKIRDGINKLRHKFGKPELVLD